MQVMDSLSFKRNKMISWTKWLILSGAVLCAASCAKEGVTRTEDAGYVCIGVSVQQSPTRTVLGEKDKGSYKLYWSEGDVLDVNGTPSSAASILADRSKANFKIPSSVSLPYNIVYPYKDGNSGDGTQMSVSFAAIQDYFPDSFGQGYAPMYGYSLTFADVQMHYLAGAVRLDVTGTADDVLSQIILSCEGATLAGDFEINCETGVLGACHNASNSISYNMPQDGVVLSDQPTSFFITLPAGDYGTIDAMVLTGKGEAMTVHLSADGIKAGTVREYPEFAFTPQAEYFIIGDDADMQQFASLVSAGEFTWDKALLSRDIDMTGQEWTPVDGFTKIFDGAGHSIKGLGATLFGELEGTLCNLTLDVDIHAGGGDKEAAAVRTLSGGAVSNVTLTGTIEYVTDAAPAEVNIGGIAAYFTGGTISDCVNNATIKVNAQNASGKVRLAGIVGFSLGTEGGRLGVKNCVNNGQLIPQVKLNELDFGTMAGRAEYTDFENCSNSVPVTFSSSEIGFLYGGALAGVAKNSSLKKCTNSAAMTFEESLNVKSYFYSSAVAAYSVSTTVLEDCTNSGDITFGKVDWAATRFTLGGVVGYGDNNAGQVKGCSNSGNITLQGSVAGSANYGAAGGIAGRTAASVTGCGSTGKITSSIATTAAEMALGGIAGSVYSLAVSDCRNEGEIIYNVQTNESGFCKAFYLGGALGAVIPSAAGELGYENISNTAPIIVNGTPAAVALKTGGAAGRNNASRDDMTDANRIAIGGVAGRVIPSATGATTTMKGCSNSGSISAPDAGKIRYTAFGGVCGEIIAASLVQSGCSNSGDISVAKAYNDGTNLHLGGLVGFIPNKKFADARISIVEGTNTGNISLSEINNTIQEARAGGILGDMVSCSDTKYLTLVVENCVNRGNISRTSNKRFASQSFGGGIVGAIGAGTWSYNSTFSYYNALVKNCENYGTIQFDACNSKGKAVAETTYNESATGGIIGGMRGCIASNGTDCPAVVESCRNYGEVKGCSGFLGGICGIISYYGKITGTPASPCLNEGAIGLRRLTNGNPDTEPASYADDLTTCGGITGELFQGKLPTGGSNPATMGYNVYCDNAVNKGMVGGKLAAGGIAGHFNEVKSTQQDILSCANSGTVYGFYGIAGAITGSELTTDETLGRVRSCKVGGTVVRGTESNVLAQDNFYNFIYQKAVPDDGLNTYWDGK